MVIHRLELLVYGVIGVISFKMSVLGGGIWVEKPAFNPSGDPRA